MTLLSDLIEQVLQRLSPERRDQIDKLNGALTSNATSLTVTYTDNGLSPAGRVSIDMEDIWLWAAAQKTASVVQRGFNGSTAATHADGSIVRLAPTYSPFEIGRAINEKLAALPGEGVYKFTNVSLTGSSSTVGYNLTSVTDLIGVHRVRYKAASGQGEWPVVPADRWRVGQGMPTSSFASAEALFLSEGVDAGQPIDVQYKAPFTALNLTTAGLAENVETISGLPGYAHELLTVGAAILLTLGRSLERSATDAQGPTRRPNEVTTSDTRMAPSPLQLEYQQALNRARREQLRRYGA